MVYIIAINLDLNKYSNFDVVFFNKFSKLFCVIKN